MKHGRMKKIPFLSLQALEFTVAQHYKAFTRCSLSSAALSKIFEAIQSKKTNNYASLRQSGTITSSAGQRTLVQIEKVSFRNYFLGFSSIKRHPYGQKCSFSLFSWVFGPFLIILQNDIHLLHMLKIKGEIFELQVFQQFATTQNLMCKLQMIV